MLKSFQYLVPYTRPLVQFTSRFHKHTVATTNFTTIRPSFRTYITTETMSQPEIITAGCCIIGYGYDKRDYMAIGQTDQFID
jgi:hypothetical protein